MQTYYSTFITGFEEPVVETLRQKIPGVTIDKVLKGAVVYRARKQLEKIKQLKFLNNTFLVLNYFDHIGPHFLPKLVDEATRTILDDKTILPTSRNTKTFRIVTAEENEMVTLDEASYRKLASAIAKTLRLRLVRAKPSLEFWLMIRNEGIAIFGLRLTERRWSRAKLDPGSLSTEIAEILCLLSDPQKDDVFIDSLAGSGSIPLARYYLKGFKEIWAGDQSLELVEMMKRRFKEARASDIKLERMDSTDLAIFKDGSVNKIVTDPPWGIFKPIDPGDLAKFYQRLFQEFGRVLKKDGTAVLLLSRDLDVTPLLGGEFQVLKRYDILYSGKKASVYKLRRI
jgi:tRNA (guanine6-N2)-methyltransferase